MESAENHGEDNRRRLLDYWGRITDGDCWTPGGG